MIRRKIFALLAAKPVLLRKNIRQRAFQALHDLMEVSQRNALLALFEPMQSRGRQASLSRKFGEGHVAALFAEKRGKLFFENIAHIRYAWENTFRLRNILLTKRGKLDNLNPAEGKQL